MFKNKLLGLIGPKFKKKSRDIDKIKLKIWSGGAMSIKLFN